LSPDKIFKKGLIRSFQVPRPFVGMTVLENLLVTPKEQLGEKAVLAPFRSSWKAQEVQLAGEAADILDVLALLPVHRNLSPDISGGQMKLAEMGRALMGHPKILLLDEPTAGVAPRLALDIFQRIVALRDTRDVTFCIIEHRLDVLFRFIERAIVLHEGRIIAEGTHDEILANKMVQDVYLGG
jgi:branched-chain amino acid transport system ATP-binding protein